MKSKTNELRETQRVEALAEQIARERGHCSPTEADTMEARMQLETENLNQTDFVFPLTPGGAAGMDSVGDLSGPVAFGGSLFQPLGPDEENTLAEKEVSSGVDQADAEQRKENPSS